MPPAAAATAITVAVMLSRVERDQARWPQVDRRSRGGGVTLTFRTSHGRYVYVVAWHHIHHRARRRRRCRYAFFLFCVVCFVFFPPIFFFAGGVWLAKRSEPHASVCLPSLPYEATGNETSLRSRPFRLCHSSGGSLGAPPAHPVSVQARVVVDGGGGGPPGLHDVEPSLKPLLK